MPISEENSFMKEDILVTVSGIFVRVYVVQKEQNAAVN